MLQTSIMQRNRPPFSIVLTLLFIFHAEGQDKLKAVVQHERNAICRTASFEKKALSQHLRRAKEFGGKLKRQGFCAEWLDA